ncbi:MAG TPA: hypothetical protein VL172_17755 [Kofleriaceae bacterium]|jgi:hypothetical protein|nr:hypothetical protein [Kofleriaceae bacterium]
MPSSRSPLRWQRLPKARKAAVYRAIGRAARDARESGDRDVAADVRTAMDVLRSYSHARPGRRPTRARVRRKRS